MSRISALEKKVAEQGNEVGRLRKENQQLKDALKAAQHQESDTDQFDWYQDRVDALVDEVQELRDCADKGSPELLAANARLTEDAQRHFDARKKAEKHAADCLFTEQHWKRMHDSLTGDMQAVRVRLRALLNVEAELGATRAKMASCQKELIEFKAQMDREKNLGRDTTKPSAVLSKRFKHLEL